MTTENTVNKTIDALYNKGEGTTNRDELIIAVFTKHADIGLNKSTALVAKWMKDNGLAVIRKGINAAFDEWLIDACESGEPKTAADVAEYIKDEGTPNMERHKTIYQGRAALAAAAYKKGLGE